MSDRDNITLPREVVQDVLDALMNADDFSPGGTRLYRQEIDALRAALAAEQPSEDIEALRRDAERYYELLMVVGMKHPGETRHETALRYIQQAEQQCVGPDMEDKR